MKGNTLADIGKVFNCSKSAVKQLLDKYLPDGVDVESVKKYRAEILTAKSSQLLTSLTPDKIKEMTGQSLATSFGILYDKERLERNLSTDNVSVAHLDSDLVALQAKKKQLEDELNDL